MSDKQKENLLLKSLFPDTTVLNTIKRVMSNTSSFAEPMSTNYSFLDSDKSVTYTSVGQACFGGLRTGWISKCKVDKKNKYLSYLPQYSLKCNAKLRTRWIELGQELGILDESVTAKHIHTNGILVDLKDPKLTIGELYLQLTFMRWLREAPYLVMNIVDLVDNAGRDFWASAQFCHSTNMGRVDHSLLPFSAGYAVGGNHKDISRDLGLTMRMHKVTVLPRSTDKRTIVKTWNGTLAQGAWNWFSTTVKPEKNIIVKHPAMLLSSELHPLIYTGNVETAIKMLKTLKDRKSCVEFEEQKNISNK